MTLSNHQFEFVKDVSMLLDYAAAMGYKITFGETYRTKEQQEIYYKTGRSKTMNSNHRKRLAIDLNVFTDTDGDGKKEYTTKYEFVKPLGDYWESLSPYNRWGGDWNGNDVNDESFVDTPHFERNI